MKDDVRPDKTTISDAAQVVSAYARWAPVYDLVFTAVMRAGRQAAVAALGPAPRRVLDVGVGTGLELPMFPANMSITGIDLAEPMLRRAQARVARRRLAGVEGLCVMDATQLAFPDETFDAAVVPYVLTVVPDPEAMMDEIVRVLKPGGDIILVNHFGAADRTDRGLARPARRLTRLASAVSVRGSGRLACGTTIDPPHEPQTGRTAAPVHRGPAAQDRSLTSMDAALSGFRPSPAALARVIAALGQQFGNRFHTSEAVILVMS